MMKYILQRKTLPVVNSRDQFGVRCFFLIYKWYLWSVQVNFSHIICRWHNCICNGSYLEAKGNIDRELAKYLKWLKTSKVTPNAKKKHHMFVFRSEEPVIPVSNYLLMDKLDMNFTAQRFLELSLIRNQIGKTIYHTLQESFSESRYVCQNQKLFQSRWIDVLVLLICISISHISHMWVSTYKGNLRWLVVLQTRFCISFYISDQGRILNHCFKN